ncbi:hypothetical protein HRbin02_00462 [Candidatus Calditenuaceae archaeon HR02]|nr:hypothetical protein HRbin02_00462 [Candidatus Calditenuaceae archaeon HR02]
MEINGYVSGIRPRRAGKTFVIEVSISTLSGESYEAVLHDPPDWLEIGSKIACKIEKIPGRQGATLVVSELKPSLSLPDIAQIELSVESVSETPDGSLMVEGRKEGGGFFSYLLRPENATIDVSDLPCRAIALKTLQLGVDQVIAIVPVKNLQIMRRAKEFIVQLKKEEESRPELEFLPGPP